jgi:tetratricopeptide (TPR) repeat protein
MKTNIFLYKILIVLVLTAGQLVFAAEESSQQNLPIKPQGSQREQIAQRDNRLFRMAQSYINMNKYQQAIPILEELFSRNPKNIGYYSWLLKAYLNTAQFQTADSLVDLLLYQNPKNPTFQIDKGSVLYHVEGKQIAIQMWRKVLEENSKNLNIYNQVASTMIRNRLVDEAIAVYQDALIQFPNVHSYYQNIANLYKNQLRYIEATDYYLKYLSKEPEQKNFVFNQILSFHIEPELRQALFNTLEEKSRHSEQAQEIKLLMAQLHQRYREFDKAFLIYQDLESDRSNGALLLKFAQAAERDSSYQVALEAYKELTRKYPKSPHLISAYNGAITTNFSLARQTESQLYAARAIELIDTARVLFPNDPALQEIVLLKGIIYLEYYFDVDKAIEILSEIPTLRGVNPNSTNLAHLKLAECHTIKGQLDLALKDLQKIQHRSYRGQAMLKQAEIFYFQKDWEESLKIIDSIIKQEGVSSEVTNDALALKFKLNHTKNAASVLGSLAEAELLAVQRKKSQAIKELILILEMEPVPPLLKGDVYLKIVEFSIDLEEYTEALKYSHLAIQDSAISPYADKHLFLMASLLEKHFNRFQEAFDSYQKLLIIYPNSLLAARVRERMKYLKDQKIIEIP